MLFWKKASRQEVWPLYGFLTVAVLLFAFGHIAEEAIEGDWAAFDRNILLALRVAGDPSRALGPIWLQEAARDLTALGSALVISLLTAGAAGYLFLIGKRSTAFFVLASI